MRLKARGFVAVLLALIPATIVAIVWLAWRDAQQEAARIGGPSAGLVLDGVRLSLRHGVRVEFRTIAVPELSLAQWRLVPFRDVDFSK
ncbi:MAG: hypothetical protein J0L78_05800 [Planctomycetes bacterium]|nr:hypothetical protein [Planctomycetota bacterium]